MNKPIQQTPQESPKNVGIGCLIVMVMFVIVGTIMHLSGETILPQPEPAQMQTALGPDPSAAPSLDRVAIRQFASEEGRNIHEVNGDLATMARLFDPPQFGNDLWFSNVKDECGDIEFATRQGLKIKTPHQCRPTQQEYVLYLSDVEYYAHWLPGSIKALQRSGNMEAVNVCNEHLRRATVELKKAKEAAAALDVQLEVGN